MRARVRFTALGLQLALLLVAWSQPRAAAAVCSCTGQFDLRIIGATTFQVALAWDGVPGAVGYTLERSTSCDFAQPANCDVANPPTCYHFSSFVTAFGDTGKQPTERTRFNQPSGLQAGTTYYYRMRAQLPSGELISDCESAQLVDVPTRGIAGDLYADLVLGKPDFAQSAFRKTTATHSEWAGGITIDRTRIPNRLFLADTNRNRILGFDHLGHCADAAPCTSDADCTAGVCVLEHPQLSADIALGQSDLVDKSACNGDSTGEHYPQRAAASAGSLCLVKPEEVSPGESVSEVRMVIDPTNGDLYVPDLFNNRVLRYDHPQSGVGQLANGIWGQNSFEEYRPNGGASVSAAGLSLGAAVATTSVALDHQRHLWVADSGNARVLRFPRLPDGSLAATADVVLGQSSCDSVVRGDYITRPLTQFEYPISVAVNPNTRKLYVLDSGLQRAATSRVIAYTLPLDLPPRVSCGSEPLLVPQQLLKQQAPQFPFYCDQPDHEGLAPTALIVDPLSNGLWVENNCFFAEMFSLSTLNPVYRVRVLHLTGFDLDREGNLYASDKWNDTYRFRRSALIGNGLNYTTNDAQKSVVFPGYRPPPTADGMYASSGSAVFGPVPGDQQLIIGDTLRIMIWNHFDAASLTANGIPLANGAPADDVAGDPDLETESLNEFHYFPQVAAGRLWVQHRGAGAIDAYEYPFKGSLAAGGPSEPSKRVYVNERPPAFSGYPVLGMPGKTIFAAAFDHTDFSVSASGNQMWVADRNNHRVFRINDLNGSPYVDIILGQSNLTGAGCNRGLGDTTLQPNGLCYPEGLLLDAAGNLYVADNGLEGGSNHRILEFDATVFDFKPGEVTAKFGLQATRVFGTGGSFTVNGDLASSDPYLNADKPALHPNGALFVPTNPYGSGARFVQVLTRPLLERLPQLALGDFFGFPRGSGYIDPDEGNYFFSEANWGRALVYRAPLGQMSAPTCSSYRDAVLAMSPIAYWRLGESGGTVAADEMHVYPGTYVGAPSFNATASISAATDGGDLAVSFDQANDYVQVADSAALRLGGSFAIEAWFKSNDIDQATSTVLAHGSTYAIRYNASSATLQFAANASGSCVPGLPGTKSDIPLADMQWHHIVYSFNDTTNTWAGYKDGQQIFAVTCDFALATSPATLILGAAADHSSNANVQLDEIALYNKALSPWEVRSHYEVGSCDPAATPSPTPTAVFTPVITGSPASSSTPTPTATRTPTGPASTPTACSMTVGALQRFSLLAAKPGAVNVGAGDVIGGELCAAVLHTKATVQMQSDVFATRTYGTAVRLGNASTANGNLTTGGGRVVLGSNALVFGGVDTSGTSPALDGCQAAACQLAGKRAELFALPADVILGTVKIPKDGSFNIQPPANAARVIIDLSELSVGKNGILDLIGDAGSQQVIIRVASRLRLSATSRIRLTGYAPEQILFLVGRTARFGAGVTIEGTICADRVRVGRDAMISGALLANLGVGVGRDSSLSHRPFVGW